MTATSSREHELMVDLFDEIKTADKAKQYHSRAVALPGMIRRHGLSRTLLFLEAKNGDKAKDNNKARDNNKSKDTVDIELARTLLRQTRKWLGLDAGSSAPSIRDFLDDFNKNRKSYTLWWRESIKVASRIKLVVESFDAQRKLDAALETPEPSDTRST